MRILLLGGSSLVGAAIRTLPEWQTDWAWTYCSNSCNASGGIQLDLTDQEQVRNVILQIAPTHILDTALPNRENPEAAKAAAMSLARELGRLNHTIRYVFVSTDAVFSGNASRPYVETDPVNPCSKYGEAKVAAEEIISKSFKSFCIARTCLVYGRDCRTQQPTLDPRSSELISRLRTGSVAPQYTGQYRTPTFLGDLAPMLLKLASADYTGIIHLAGFERFSRAGFAQRLAEALGFDPRLVIDQPLPALLSFGLDTSLASEKARKCLGWEPRRIAQAFHPSDLSR